jgi:hypothetical protein
MITEPECVANQRERLLTVVVAAVASLFAMRRFLDV